MFHLYVSARIYIPAQFRPFFEIVDWSDTTQAWEITDVHKMEYDSFHNDFHVFFEVNGKVVEMHLDIRKPNDILAVCAQ